VRSVVSACRRLAAGGAWQNNPSGSQERESVVIVVVHRSSFVARCSPVVVRRNVPSLASVDGGGSDGSSCGAREGCLAPASCL